MSDQDGNPDTAFLTVTINGVDEVPIATDNTNAVTPEQQPTTSGSVIYDDDGFGSDSADRPFSQLIWENEFASEQAVNGANVTVDGVTVSLTSIDPQGNQGAANHQVSYGTNGGHTGYLRFTAEAAEATNTPHELNVDFSAPVTNLSFTLADLDWSQQTSWQDQFTIFGLLDGEVVDLSAQVSGTVVQLGDNTFYETGQVPNTEAHGNVNILFTPPIDEVRILYNYGPDATVRDGFQIGALSDLNWQSTGVPRVSSVDGIQSDVGQFVTGAYGTFIINSDGSYSYTVDENNADVIALTATGSLTDTIPYTLIDTLDDSGNTDTALLTITINGSNDKPIAQNDIEATGEDIVLSSSVLTDNGNGQDSDAEGDTLSVTEVNGTAITSGGQITLPSGALLTMNSDGSYDYDPNGVFASLATGASTTDSFLYTIDDGNGGTDTATVTINITGVNTAPDATDNTNTAVEDSVAAVSGNMISDDDGNGADSDPESAVLTVATVNGTTLSGATSITGTYGTLTVNADGSYSYALDNANTTVNALSVGDSLQDVFAYVVSDPEGATDNAQLTITIDGANDAPIAQDDAATTDQDTAITGDVLVDNGNGVDSDPEGDALSVTAITSMSGDNGGTFTIGTNGAYSFDPGTDFDSLDDQSLSQV